MSDFQSVDNNKKNMFVKPKNILVKPKNTDSRSEEKKTATPADSKPEGEKKSTGLPSSLGLLASYSDSEDSSD